MKKLFLIITLIFIANFANAQGCSDAGICSIGSAFKVDERQYKNSIEIATVFGAGEADVTYFAPYISYVRKFNDKISLSTKVTFSSANGNFGTRAAFGDGFVVGNYAFKEKNKYHWSALVGFKIPFTSSNLKINYYSLPLDYQSSLGTFDLLVGSNLHYKKWDFNAALQIPVFNNNKNSYFKELSGTTDFPSTNLFERKSDVLLRATYTLKTTNQKFTIKPNILFIYHLGEDSFENTFGKRTSIVGSNGLTINGNLITNYAVNKQNSVELSLATPFLVRDIRPDGLTRKYVIGILYKYVF